MFLQHHITGIAQNFPDCGLCCGVLEKLINPHAQMHVLGPLRDVELKDSGHSANDQGGKTTSSYKNGPEHVLSHLRNSKEPS